MERPVRKKKFEDEKGSEEGGSAKKRKAEDGQASIENVCFIHMTDSKCQDFIFLKNTRDPDVRLQKLLEIRDKRLCQPFESPNRMEDVCRQIPSTYSICHGYHRDCYQRFTSNLNRLIPQPKASLNSGERRESRRSSTEKDYVLFQPDCIFCNKVGKKGIKVRGVWTTESTTKFEHGGGEAVIMEAEKKQDSKLLLRISGFELFACEAMYHRSCRSQYMQRPEKWRSSNPGQVEQQVSLEKAHKQSFNRICELINENVVKKNDVLRLTDLRNIYVSELAKTPHSNPSYRGENLKTKLEKLDLYKDTIGFCPIRDDGRFKSYLVYNLKGDVGTAVKATYTLRSVDKSRETARNLRNDILNKFEASEQMTWPPTVQSLPSQDILPKALDKFLKCLLSGNEDVESVRVNRLANSLGQDICRAVTHGRWKLPKHILLGMTLHHLFRSAELVKLMNKLGHAENYSFLLEVETAIAVALQTTSSLLPVSIIRNPSCPSAFHSDFDNYDEFINDLSGAGSVHRSHGIMLQDLVIVPGEATGGFKPPLPSIQRTRQRTLTEPADGELPDCYLGRRQSPGHEVIDSEVDGGKEAYRNTKLKNLLWLLIRLHAATVEQRIPGWGGYISLTGETPCNLTTVEYYPVIPHPITDNRAVKECLRYSEEGSKEVGQHYVITTFDLGVCMKAYPLIWNSPTYYENHIVMIGTFHLVCAYLKMIGKKMRGTGLSDILLEAGLSSPGSISGVISGKNYGRSIHCHKVLVESLERLLLIRFLEDRGEKMPFDRSPQVSKRRIIELIQSVGSKTEAAVLQDRVLRSYIEDYIKFRDGVRQGDLGKTAKLWMSYIDHVWLALALLQAVKTNNFVLYGECICLMPDLFFSFDGQNYARYLTFFGLFIANIERSHPGATELLKRGAISVARSFIPGNRCAVDKTIEETFMKNAKSRGGSASGAGISGILTNYGAYQRWARTSKERAEYLQATYSMADMTPDAETGKTHKDVRHAEVARSEKQVKRTVEAVMSFNNPFDLPDPEKMYCLSSGAPARSDVESDILRADAVGAERKDQFIEQRLKTHENFFEPIKRLKLKTMEDMNKSVIVKSSTNKAVEYKQQGTIAFQLLVQSQNLPGANLDLRELLTYPVTPVPLSLAGAHGYMAKTDKSKGLTYLAKDFEDCSSPHDIKESLVIEDGNACFYYMKELPNTFGEIAQKIFRSLTTKHDVFFSTDMYRPDSVKSAERRRRGCGDKLILSGEKTRRPKDWGVFLTNDENKEQLIQILLSTWSGGEFTRSLKDRSVSIVVEGRAYRLTSDGETTSVEELVALKSTQEETDSRIILYCLYAKEVWYKCVRVRSPDSDIFILLFHASRLEGIRVLFETGRGNTKRCLDMTKIAESVSPVLRSALLGLHAFSGCDSVSSFKGKGKVKAIKILQKNVHFQEAFCRVGEMWEVDKDVHQLLEEFTCALYGKPHVKAVNELRYLQLQAKCANRGILDPKKSFDMSSLPPCQSCLQQHVERANYQVAIWRRANIPVQDMPNPTDGHGWVDESGTLQPKWTDHDILPAKLVDILEQKLDSENSEDEDDDDDNDNDQGGDEMSSSSEESGDESDND